ncbi:MAG: FapA family protein [Spirochaetaceae bacterium]|nr:FapA family protein [Spirochaetaceae bacterium]
MALKTTAKGKLDVSLSEDGLEALITFTPGEQSAEIDTAFLSRLLQMKGVREGISPKDLENLLGKLKGAKEAFGLCVARGTPPQDPVPENAVWEKLDIPPELQEDGTRAFAAAGEPQISVEKIENIRHEKIIEKKSPIPFAPSRKEKVVEIEKKVTRQKVAVDPEVAGTGYAAEGALLAQIEPFEAGKPGKSVTGALVPAKSLEAPYVYAGAGIQKKSGKLIAKASGFVRWGKNWAELLQFRGHDWKVFLSPDKLTCFLSLAPGDIAAASPPAEAIRAAAIALPYDEKLLLSAQDIAVLAREIIAEGLSAQRPLSLPGDAEANITVSEDRLEASLFLRKGRGSGKPLSLKEVGKLIQDSGLAGLNLKKIQTDIMAFHKGPDLVLEKYVLAKGRVPAAGSAAEIRWEINALEGKALADLKKSMPPAKEAAGPYADIASITQFPPAAAELAAFVAEGDKILSVKPGKFGSPGMDVYGKAIPAPLGEEFPVVCRENAEQEQTAVIARIAGLMEARKNDDNFFEIRVRPHRDGVAEVTLSPDQMQALITVVPALGTGRGLAKEAVSQAISKAGVVYKAQDQKALDELSQKIAAGEAVLNIPFASGKQPKDGVPPRLKILIDTTVEKVAIRGDGKADYKNSSSLLCVKKDQAIAEILASEKDAEDGWDVTGRPLGAKAAGTQEIVVGKNIRAEKKDAVTLLFAEANGELQFDEKSISVVEGHVINGNVDLKTGNIKFPGSVFVSGFVEAGFFIMSGGDIKVTQGMEAALLSAEGSIAIEQGVKGMGKAVLRAKKDISAAFVEQTVILAVGDVAIKASCVRCNLRCNGKLTLESDKGIALGGVIKARGGIEAASIGNEKGLRTEISFGQDYLLADRIENLEKTIQKHNQANASLNVEMREAEKSGDKKRLQSCHAEKLKNIKIVENLGNQLLTLREKFEEHFPASVVVRGTLYPGVVIESHGRYYEPKQPRTNITVTFDEESGKIVEVF